MEIRHIGVLGSGIMGSGIAECAAEAGFEVTLRSRKQDTADQMRHNVEKSLLRKIERGKISQEEAKEILSKIRVTTNIEALAPCDLLIESVVEDLTIKKHLFAELSLIVGETAILATNTSTLAVVEIAAATKHPERVCGIHFFNPATLMKLVEIVKPITASDETIEAAQAFARACKKDVVTVKDQAGFIVNALLFPYLNNAIKLYESAMATMEEIDISMRGGCGFPMGPFALLDLVGLDTSLAILNALYEEFKEPNYAPSPLLRRMVAAGYLGRKSKRGFFDYR
ncbi:3-hydroxyacyl-CoA dehydrogenase family protein [Acidithrix ferrooxidans]|uniref:3-hydroxybutyryl-CoA dehydrogenase n=2 Tax=root TaxID=1 RepID=A0A0D8HFP8_9ACTN|nr:3-hydroxybutyryl-CoA dehydrogenase [Acidithrix ferrooxidans]KJF16709.1 3-hydroxybutyryl-CoA dehydrogenase [Acidithrix ferrooxidans]